MAKDLSLPALVGVAALLLVGGAMGADADFGRHAPDNDPVSWLQSLLTQIFNGSSFNRTDAEVDLTNRLWRFVAPPQGAPWVLDRPGSLRPLGLRDGPAIGRYYTWLQQTSYQSSTVRYATVRDDIDSDLQTVPGVFVAVCAVEAIDRRSAVAEANLSLGAATDANVAAREAANDAQIDGFVAALRYRYASYNYALDHLLVETPDPAARGVDADLAQLKPEVEAAMRSQFCSTGAAPHVGNPHPGPSIPSRFVHGNPKAAPADSAATAASRP